MELLKQISLASKQTPERLFLKDAEKQLSFEETLNCISTFQKKLYELDLKEDDNVIILLPNSTEFAIALLSVLNIGCVAIPISPLLTKSELDEIIGSTATKLIISNTNFSTKIESENPRILINSHSLLEDAKACYNEDLTINKIDHHKVQLIILTSGSEGKPKGVCHTMRSLLYTTEQLKNDFWMINETDKVLMIAPAHSIFGITLLFTASLAKSSLIFFSEFNPQNFIKALVVDKTTFFAGVPMVADFLIKLKDKIDIESLHLRKVMIGGAPLNESTELKLKDLYNIEVITGYGMTEGVPLTYRNEKLKEFPAYTVGKVAEGIELKIEKDTNESTEGEIVVKGEQLFSGYLIDGVINRFNYQTTWFHTGDIGRLDSDGFLFITGRKKDMIIRNGFSIFPAEIELALKQVKGVIDCSIIGVQDQLKGEKIVAFIMITEETNSNEIKTSLAQLLSKNKLPNEFIVIEKIPKNSNGKTDKLALKNDYLSN